jgi:L-rhamnose mutarotase
MPPADYRPVSAEGGAGAQRHASVVGLRPEHADAYLAEHERVWSGVLEVLTRCNVRNYSIFQHRNLLISYFEYVGQNFKVDMATIAADRVTQAWWALVQPYQRRLEETPPGEWWLPIPEVFHLD